MTTLADVLSSTVDLIALFDGREDEMRAWWAGTATGGHNADSSISDGVAPNGGFYPATNSVGVTSYLPSIAYLRTIMLKGDQGVAAAQDVAIDITGTFGPNEYIAGFICPHATTFVPASSYAKCRTAPVSSYTIVIKKNGSAWGTIVFGAGSTTGAVTISSPSLIAGDLVEYFAPATPDTLTDLIHTLRGT
jgi:hypothetical protein